MDVERLSPKWLAQFETHKMWFRSLKSRRGKPLSETMKQNYNSSLKRLMEFFESKGDKEWNPDLIIEWAKMRVQTGEFLDLSEVLIDFSQWLQGKSVEGYSKRELSSNQKYLSPSSAHNKSQGSIRGFFTHNYIPMPKPPKPDKSVRKSKSNDSKYRVFKADKITDKIVRDLTDLRLFMSELSFRDQTIALALLSTSQDIGDVLNLDIGFVEAQEDRERLQWDGTRIKTGERFTTFFSKEATQYLRKYIAQYRKGAKSVEGIFWSPPRKYNGREIEGRNLKPRAISDNFFNASQTLGFTNGGATQHPFRPKRFRHIFATACTETRFSQGKLNYQRIFMGHKLNVGDFYPEHSDSKLESEYAKVEPLITVYSEEKTQELDKVKEDAKNALGISLKLEAENRELRTTVDELKYMVTSLKNDLELMQNDAEAQEAERSSPEATEALAKVQGPIDIQAMYEQMQKAMKKLEESGQVIVKKQKDA